MAEKMHNKTAEEISSAVFLFFGSVLSERNIKCHHYAEANGKCDYSDI